MEPITYGPHTIDVGALPQVSIDAMIRRGLTHFLGNEQASKVSAFKTKTPDATAEQIEAFKAECVAKAVAALTAGSVGVRAVAGPKATPVEKVMRELALAHIGAVLAKSGAKVPTGDKTVQIGAEAFTREQLIARQFARDEAGYRAKAERELKRRAAEVAKAEGLEAL